MAASAKAAKARGGGTASVASLNNVLMQMRKNANHPDLITSAFDGSTYLPDAKDLVAQCGKMKLVARILKKVEGKHKVLIFSQVRWAAAFLRTHAGRGGADMMRTCGRECAENGGVRTCLRTP